MVNQGGSGSVQKTSGLLEASGIFFLHRVVFFFVQNDPRLFRKKRKGQVELCRMEVRSTATEFGQDRRTL